jgi:hypothetical protein
VSLHLIGIDGLKQVEIEVSGPSNANRLFIVVGIVRFSFDPVGVESFGQVDKLTFDIGPDLLPGQFKDAAVTSSLASNFGSVPPFHEELAIDSVLADFNSETRRVRINASLTFKGQHGSLDNRIGFQANILAAL